MSIHRLNRRRVVLVGLCLVPWLQGCEEESPLARALYESSKQLNALAPGGAAPATPEYKARVFGDVIRSLQTNANAGTESERAAALGLIAQAQAGLAENPAAEAAVDQRQALNILTGIESALNQWQRHGAAATAAGTFDPGPALNEIERESRARENEIARENARKAEVDAAVKRLLTQAASIAENARSRRAAQLDLAGQASSQSAVRAEELIKQAAQIGREADALEAQAADLEAQAAKTAPVIAEIQLSIDKLTRQRALLDESRAEIAARAKAYADAARAARDEAQKDADEIESMVRELQKVGAAVEGQASAFDRAVQGFDSSAGTAAKAKAIQSARAQASLTCAASRHALGDLHWSRAHTLARYIETFDALANATPPLPAAGDYKAAAARAREERAAALEAATTAYEAAFADYQASGAKGEVQDRVEELRRRLGQAAKATSGGKLDLLAGSGSVEEAAAPAEEPGATAAAAGETPQAAVERLIQSLREGRYADLAGALHATNTENQEVVEQLPPLLDALGRLDAACKAKFQQGLMQIGLNQAATMMGGQGIPTGTLAAPNFDELSVDALTFEVEGETARVTPSGGGQSFRMRRVDGAWLVDLSEFEQMIDGQPDAAKWRELIVSMLPQVSAILASAAGEVEAGVYTSAENFLAALNAKFAPLTFQAMGKMQELGLQMPGGAPGAPPALPTRPGGG